VAAKLAVAAKRKAEGDPSTGGRLYPEWREASSIAGEARDDEGDVTTNRRKGGR
jgi:hypothetical protein